MGTRTKYSDQHILRKRAQGLTQLSELCETVGRSFKEDCPLAPGTHLGQLYSTVTRKDATKGFPERQVRELGKFANGLGLDGLDLAKWFLSSVKLHNTRVCKRLRDAINKHARKKTRVKVSSMQVPAIDELTLTVVIGGKRTTHRLLCGDSIVIGLAQSDPKSRRPQGDDREGN